MKKNEARKKDYQIWWEYLKLSDRYEKFCRLSKETNFTGDLPPNLVPQVKLGFFHFMFINEAMLAVPEDDYSTSCAA